MKDNPLGGEAEMAIVSDRDDLGLRYRELQHLRKLVADLESLLSDGTDPPAASCPYDPSRTIH
ncbi:hypothetical protein [Bradyrhizobium sp. ORS 111]|uniref:hypothetical protein n=1 Tax=Bradyrhizobium sp. ORS 111 TaxID=1685958 RepID=UPI00388FD88E